MIVLLIVLGCVALVSVVTVIAFRYVTRRFDLTEVAQEGAVLLEDGIELARPLLLGKTVVNYSNVESVELIPFPRSIGAFLYYGFAADRAWTRPFSDLVVIKLSSPPCFVQYVMVTPKDPVGFCARLKSHIGRNSAAS